MNSSPLIQFGKLILSHETEPATDVEKHIVQTLLGSPDGIRYRLLDSADKIYEIKPLHFFPLRKGDELIYVMALVERITAFKSKTYITYNARYVSFDENYSTTNKNTIISEAVRKRIGNSFIKEAMKKHAETFAPTLQDPAANSGKKLYYAYVEESNFRSMDFTAFFFERIRSFSVLSFSRIFPKKDFRVELVFKESSKDVLEIISEFYHNHSFFFVDKNKIHQEYFVLKENNEIIAGLKAGISNWKIEQLPGFTMRILLKTLPRIPFLRRLIQPGLFRFLTFDTIVCKQGREDLLPILFESVCALKKVYSAMIYMDTDTEICSKVKQIKNMGILNNFFSEAKGVVLARFVNFSKDEIKDFYHNPVYISGYDLS